MYVHQNQQSLDWEVEWPAVVVLWGESPPQTLTFRTRRQALTFAKNNT